MSQQPENTGAETQVAAATPTSVKKERPPKRNLRFLVIYIILLFAVSAVFLVTSFLADQNNNTKLELGKAKSQIEQLEHELSAQADKATKDIDALKKERDELSSKVAGTEADLSKANNDIEALNKSITAKETALSTLEKQLETVQKELDGLKASAKPSPSPTATTKP